TLRYTSLPGSRMAAKYTPGSLASALMYQRRIWGEQEPHRPSNSRRMSSGRAALKLSGTANDPAASPNGRGPAFRAATGRSSATGAVVEWVAMSALVVVLLIAAHYLRKSLRTLRHDSNAGLTPHSQLD